MARLSRAEQQARTRARVLAAARDEFAERGFREAKIDRIADRADLTRGAVYSNFVSKRALHLAVLIELAEHAPDLAHLEVGLTPQETLGSFARAWIARLPLTGEPHSAGWLRTGLVSEVLAEERLHEPFAQAMALDALLLGLALEAMLPRPARRVRVAEIALTALHGVSQMAAAAPGFADPFDTVRLCERLATLDLDDAWQPAHVPFVAPADACDEPWSPPPGVDVVAGEPAPLGADGVVAVLGVHRLEAAEEAVRAVPAGEQVTVAVVTADPDELGQLARLAVLDLVGCLRQAFPRPAWPRLRVVLDGAGAIAAAAGIPAVGDATEVAVRIRGGRIVARAEKRGAAHAAASAEIAPTP